MWIVRRGNEMLAALTMNPLDYPRKRTMSIDFFGARDTTSWRGEWPHLLEVLKAFTLAAGCESLEIMGRPGWLRALGSLGWKPRFAVMELEVSNGRQ